MRLRLTRGPLVCLRHVTLFLYCVLQRLLRREETYLTIIVRTITTSSPSCARPPRGAFPSTTTPPRTHYATPTTTGSTLIYDRTTKTPSSSLFDQ